MHSAAFVSCFAGLAAAQSILKASFTQYGTGDQNHSPSCNRTSVACGYWSAGYYAAISQNFYGGASGTGAGYACEQCWLLTPQADANGNKLNGAHQLVVKINDLCPIQSNNQPCLMQSQTDKNYLGANVNFDLCIDDGAAAAFFPQGGPFLAIGQAQRVPCSQWTTSSPCMGNCTAFPDGPGTGTVSSKTTTSTSVSSSTQCAQLYSQCGGQGWTGSTCCQSGSTCQPQNLYYSQCLPPQ